MSNIFTAFLKSYTTMFKTEKKPIIETLYVHQLYDVLYDAYLIRSKQTNINAMCV